MHDLPEPILGEVTALTIATPDLDKSFAFYQKLGFSEIMRADWPFPWIQVSDGILLIMLRKDPKPYLALTYYTKNIDSVTIDLEKKGIIFSEKPKKADMLQRYRLQSPDDLNITLINIIDGFKQPPGLGMLYMPQEDLFKPEKYTNKVCGLYGELAHPVAHLERSLEFWHLLGFKAISRFTTPYPWAIISDGLSIVGLHQSTDFSYPAITYFASDMNNKVAKLKKAGVKDIKDHGSNNYILTTPEKQHIFLFSLGGGDTVEKKKKPEIKQLVLETKRLLLKELNQEILDQLFTTYADDDIKLFLGLKNTDELNTEKSKWQNGYTTYRTSFKSFLMIEKESGKVIGKAGFHNWYAMHRRAELGYALSDETAKRKGYTTEAVQAIINHGFEQMDLNRIEAYAGPTNIASVKILRGAGFTEEGTLRSHFCRDGKMEDSVCFSLLRNEWTKKLKKKK